MADDTGLSIIRPGAPAGMTQAVTSSKGHPAAASSPANNRIKPRRLSSLRNVLASLDPAHQLLEPLGRLLAKVRVIHPAELVGDGEQRVIAQANDVVAMLHIVIRQCHFGSAYHRNSASIAAE